MKYQLELTDLEKLSQTEDVLQLVECFSHHAQSLGSIPPTPPKLNWYVGTCF